MADKEVVRTEAAPAPFQGAPYSQAIRADELVFVSGQLALSPGSAGDRRRGDRGANRAGLREPARDPGGGRQRPRPDREDDRLPAGPRRLPGDERGLPPPRRRGSARARDAGGLRRSPRARSSRSTRSRSPTDPRDAPRHNPGMQAATVIATHTNTDFDAFASHARRAPAVPGRDGRAAGVAEPERSRLLPPARRRARRGRGLESRHDAVRRLIVVETVSAGAAGRARGGRPRPGGREGRLRPPRRTAPRLGAIRRPP